MGDNHRQWEAGRRPWEGGHIQHRHTLCGDNGRQGKKRAREGGHQSTKGNKKGDGRQQETMGDKGRQDLGKVDAPSNTGTHVGRQRETRGAKTPGRYKHTCGETMGDKTSGRGTRHHRPWEGETRGDRENTHVGRQWETRGHKASGKQTHQPTHVGRQWKTRGDHPTQAQTWGDTARQWEARPREGGHTIQHRHACGENGRKGETRPWEGGHANTGTCGDMEDKGRQGGKVDTPSTKGKQKGTHGETRPREGGHTIQHRHTYVETRGDKTSGGYTITSTYVGQDLRKAGTPRQCEAMGDKTSGKTNTPQSLNGRHGET